MNMKHFALEDWADFARQVIDTERKAAMQRHLDEGCEDCRKAMLMWRNVSEISLREVAYHPPESAIRVAKAHYAAYSLHKQPSSATKVARLIFDTSGQAVPLGIRASGIVPRQLLYEAGKMLVDLRLDLEGQPGRISMMGQILDSSRSERGAFDISIAILRGNETLALTTTDQYGEFHVEFKEGDHPSFRLVIGGDYTLVVPMQDIETKQDIQSEPEGGR
ncbi:MAG: hypothetical protein DMG22_07675 [Acidobacteria bacterium]|nr:MAG: hypothetical protein DMG22_07675 [Acidobacteriota bacterium]